MRIAPRLLTQSEAVTEFNQRTRYDQFTDTGPDGQVGQRPEKRGGFRLPWY